MLRDWPRSSGAAGHGVAAEALAPVDTPGPILAVPEPPALVVLLSAAVFSRRRWK